MDEIEAGHCPVPTGDAADVVTLAHGEGGRWMRRLIEERIVPLVGSELLSTADDAAQLPLAKAERLAVTTDSFVVTPQFFPGGDIGALAVCGTANDLAVSGARPRWISLALILEEGLPMVDLERVLRSIAAAARRAGVSVVTGDTKVVPRGAADRLFINTTGLGEIITEIPGPQQLQPGDQILVTGPIGQHGMAVMSQREDLEVAAALESDCGPLFDAVEALVDGQIPVRAMRDATRGGVAAVLHEWAEASQLSLAVEEQRVPVCPAVRGLSELLGLDPLTIANEGTMVVAVPYESTDKAVRILRTVNKTAATTRIGEIRPRSLAPVVVRRALGTEVAFDEPLGAPLPRIC